LDVRTQGEYSRGHITNSTLISTSDRDFVKKTMLLQKDKPLYVYCLTGSRSRSVVNYLSKQGFTHLYNLSRGIMSWKQEGYTLVKSPNVAPSISKSYTANELSGILKANNLTLIDFHAPWCAPCKKVKPIVEQAQTDFSTGIKVLTLDIEANESIKNQYSINSIPGLVLFQNGKEVWRHTGVISKEDLYKSIELYL
ncbi:MAG: thioredoxin domain-containing protein, partial [Bacteroidales bacterium]|nr:thioredoxin domain-containing protein [Bacteroidales bacterium]